MNQFEVPVEEFTTPNPVVVTEEATLDKLIQLMKEHDVRHLPVVRGRGVVGIVSDRDLRVASCLSEKEKFMVCAADIMVKNPVTVSSEETLADVAFEMSQQKIGSVIVNDEDDQFLGIFTVTDALNALIEVARQ